LDFQSVDLKDLQRTLSTGQKHRGGATVEELLVKIKEEYRKLRPLLDLEAIREP
jgi:hypothetical protein